MFRLSRFTVVVQPPRIFRALSTAAAKLRSNLLSVSDSPRIYIHEHFLSAQECAALVAMARPHLAPASIESGVQDTEWRDSDMAWIPRSDMKLPKKPTTPVLESTTKKSSTGSDKLGQKSYWNDPSERELIRSIEHKIGRYALAPPQAIRRSHRLIAWFFACVACREIDRHSIGIRRAVPSVAIHTTRSTLRFTL